MKSFKHSVFDVKNTYAQSVTFFSGVDLKCSYTADFGSTPRIEWKFKDLKGSQTLMYFDNKPTGMDKIFTVVIQFIDITLQ